MIKKLTPQIFLLLTLIAANFTVFSQKSDLKSVSKAETVAFLIEQNKSANGLIESQNARIIDLESELIVERENSTSIAKSYELAKSEIGFLKQSNEALSRAVAVNENTIALLQTDNLKQRERVKKANQAKWKAIAVAAVVIGLKVLIR